MSSQPSRTVVITGATGGIGLHSAIGIARTGARILVTGRDRARGEAAVQRIVEEAGNPHVELVTGDLSSLAGVNRLATEVLSRTASIDVLVNNAGYLGSEARNSDDGFEMHFAVNVLAPWHLTHALRTALRAATRARVVNVTGGDKPAAIDVDDLQAEKGFRGLMTYTHSKSALEAMSMALARELQPEGVTVYVVFPGRASTAMTRSLTPGSLPGPMKLMYPFMKLLFADDGGKGAAKAARSTIYAATSPDLGGITGRYFDTNCVEQALHPTARDLEVQSRIVTLIEQGARA